MCCWMFTIAKNVVMNISMYVLSSECFVGFLCVSSRYPGIIEGLKRNYIHFLRSL